MGSKISEQFVSDAADLPRLRDKNYLKGFARRFGLSDIAYMVISGPTEIPVSEKLVTSYSTEWETNYINKGYTDIDPVVSNSMRGVLPFDWDSCGSNKQSRRFFGEAAEFGVGNQGISIPIRGVTGEQALFSVSTTENKQEWSSIRRHLVSDLTYLGFLLHTKIMKSFWTKNSHNSTRLTRRERQALTWAARGKTCWETGIILGLTERTVNFYIRNATTKLRAASKAQAVAVALKEELI